MPSLRSRWPVSLVRGFRKSTFWLGVAVVAFSTAAQAADPFAENVRTTDPLTPAEQRKKFHLPPGFEIQLVAAEPDINKPMNMAFDTSGRLWVTTSTEYPRPAPDTRPGRDRLMIFEDFGPDGRARKVTQFADRLNIPIGIYPSRSPRSEPSNESLAPDSSTELRAPSSRPTWQAIVWSIPNIWLMKDTDGDGQADTREILYGPFDVTRDTHGNQASFRRGFDGWLYATHGFNNDSHVHGRDGHEVHLNSGNTYRIRLDGSRIEQHTHGQVNPFGLAWDARGNLYSSDCHSAPIYQLLEGGYYPSFGKPDDGLGFAPVLMEHSHGSTAIDGMLYYTDNLWPEEYRDNVFVGNVMTSRLNHDRLEFHGSTPKAIELPDFVTCEDPWFRPVDNQLGPDGALYIADFYNRIIGHYEVPLDHPGRDRERGRIWRVVYRGDESRPSLRNPALPERLEDLVAELESPNLPRRMLAMNEICDRLSGHPTEIDRMVKTLLGRFESILAGSGNGTDGSDYFLVHALWICDRLGRLDDPTLIRVAQAATLARIHALRLITERGHQRSIAAARQREPRLPSTLTNLVWARWKDPDALVQRCAAEVLGAWPSFAQLRPLLDLRARVSAQDTHLLYVVRKAIRDHLAEDSIFREVLSTVWTRADLSALEDVAVAVDTPWAGRFLLGRLREEKLDQTTASLWTRHTARHVPMDDIDALVGLARSLAPEPKTGDLRISWARQFAMFDAVEQGLRQRGAELPSSLRAWGGDLTKGVLDHRDELGWRGVPQRKPTNDSPRNAREGRVDGKSLLLQAADLAGRLELMDLRPALEAMLANPEADTDIRGAAYAAMAHLPPNATMLALAPVMTDGEVPTVWRSRLLEASLAGANPDGETEFAAVVRVSPYRVQVKAVRAGAALQPLAREFLSGLTLGRLPARLLQDPVVKERLAQSLIKKPKILLLDEPFGALDPGIRADMHQLVLNLRRDQKLTIFMITHDIKEGFYLGTRLWVFDKVRVDPQAPTAFGARITYDLPVGQMDPDALSEINNSLAEQPGQLEAAAGAQ